MPKTTWELPQEIADAYPEHLRPERVDKNRLKHTSPFKEWPGTIKTPLYLSAEDYEKWWSQVGDENDANDTRHWAFNDWAQRYHLIKDWSMEGLDLDILAPDPIKIPDTRLIIWMVTILQPIIQFSTSLPNWREPFSGTTTPSEKPEAADETPTE